MWLNQLWDVVIEAIYGGSRTRQTARTGTWDAEVCDMSRCVLRIKNRIPAKYIADFRFFINRMLNKWYYWFDSLLFLIIFLKKYINHPTIHNTKYTKNILWRISTCFFIRSCGDCGDSNQIRLSCELTLIVSIRTASHVYVWLNTLQSAVHLNEWPKCWTEWIWMLWGVCEYWNVYGLCVLYNTVDELIEKLPCERGSQW